MKTAVQRVVFFVAGLWFYVAAVLFFFRRGLWLGGGIFAAAGTYFLWLGVARRR